MNLPVPWLAVLFGLPALLLLMLVERCWLQWSAKRTVQGLLRKLRRGELAKPRLCPECRYFVQLTDVGVSCIHPDGLVERVAWDDLRRVEILTTDQGPFVPDVFWVLHGTESGCLIPQGATGEEELLRRLQGLPGFRNEAVIEAVPSTANRRFLCWERGRANGFGPQPASEG